MNRTEKYKHKRHSIELENYLIENKIKFLQKQINSVEDEMGELNYRIKKLEDNFKVNDVMINGESVFSDYIFPTKTEHRKQRGRTAPNRALQEELEDLLKLFD